MGVKGCPEEWRRAQDPLRSDEGPSLSLPLEDAEQIKDQALASSQMMPSRQEGLTSSTQCPIQQNVALFMALCRIDKCANHKERKKEKLKH